MTKHFSFVLIFFFLVIPDLSSWAQKPPFTRGINLTNWFQASSVREIPYNRYTRADFDQIRSLGCDVVRLPINLHSMTSGNPDYRIDPLFYTLLDPVVSWAEDLRIYLILDNHTFDPAVNTDPNVGIILEKVWKQVALHYRDRSEYLLYEILNEPHGITDAAWNVIQRDVISIIRTVDTRHTIVVGPSGYNSYYNLSAMPRYSDTNLIYTFHFYDPFLFTHQGASWVDPSMEPLAGIPFPYHRDSMPGLPASLTSTWVGDSYRNYANDGTVQKVKQLIDMAVRFQAERQVPIFCGEFGVLMNNSKDNHRIYWYEVVRKYLEEKQIAWTIWDYHGGFGLYQKGSEGLFNHNLNVGLLTALGLNVPVQTVYHRLPDSTGFLIFGDHPGDRLVESNYNTGVIDYFSEDKPNNGRFCLRWSKARQYNNIGLDMRPDRDLSVLVAGNYALDLMVRGDTPGLAFDIRFIDTKTDSPTDYPWRMGVIIDGSRAAWDGRWHHLHLPLKNFTEGGSWYNGWHDPQGKFDWKAVDRIEIVAERSEIGRAQFWFDNIHITNRDTAKVYETGVFTGISTLPVSWDSGLRAFPNPVSWSLVIESSASGELQYEIISVTGIRMKRDTFIRKTTVDFSSWEDGVYLIRIADDAGSSRVIRIAKAS